MASKAHAAMPTVLLTRVVAVRQPAAARVVPAIRVVTSRHGLPKRRFTGPKSVVNSIGFGPGLWTNLTEVRTL